MLVKSMGYWSDGEAVKTTVQESSLQRVAQNKGHPVWNGDHERQSTQSAQTLDINRMVPSDGRANRRNVWKDIKPKPYPGQHFAVFPPDLPRLCIQASTSEQGCCPVCGSQITRVVERGFSGDYNDTEAALQRKRNLSSGVTLGRTDSVSCDTLGWRPSCTHQEAIDSPEPCLILDPFIGSGTTALAAVDLNRRAVGIDLSLEYLESAKMRIITTGKLPLDIQTRV